MNFFSLAQSLLMDFVTKYRYIENDDLIGALGFIKQDSVKAKLNEQSGIFDLTPTNSRKLICFSARKSNNQPDGIAFDYIKSEQKFILRSF